MQEEKKKTKQSAFPSSNVLTKQITPADKPHEALRMQAITAAWMISWLLNPPHIFTGCCAETSFPQTPAPLLKSIRLLPCTGHLLPQQGREKKSVICSLLKGSMPAHRRGCLTQVTGAPGESHTPAAVTSSVRPICVCAPNFTKSNSAVLCQPLI